MKKLVSLVSSLIIISSLVSQDVTKPAIDNKKAPEITFEKTVHNYGTIQKSGDGNCEFVFKNTGKTPLLIQSVKATCGCTTPEWPKEPIAKGKTGIIKVKYDTNRLGKFSKTVSIISNGKNGPVELRIEGVVETPGLEPIQELKIKEESDENVKVKKKVEPIKIKTEPK